jgi:hypothetical protein
LTPKGIAALARRWTRFYTRELPAPVAQRRIEEIDADLHDHVAHERADGVGDARIARGIASRMVRGLAADIAWRRRQARRSRPSLFRSVARVGLGVTLILSLPLLAMLFTEQVAWSVADFVRAGVLLATIGTALELAARKAGGRLAALAIGGLGVCAAVLGEADDAPGLVLLGILLVASACAVVVRTVRQAR